MGIMPMMPRKNLKTLIQSACWLNCPSIWLLLVCRIFKLKSSKLLSIKYDFLPSSKLLSVTNCFLFIFPNIANWWESNDQALKSLRKTALTRFAVLLCRSIYLALPWVYKPQPLRTYNFWKRESSLHRNCFEMTLEYMLKV